MNLKRNVILMLLMSLFGMAFIMAPAQALFTILPYFDLTTTSRLPGATDAVYTLTLSNIGSNFAGDTINTVAVTAPAGYTPNSTYLTATPNILAATYLISGGASPAQNCEVRTTAAIGIFDVWWIDPPPPNPPALVGSMTINPATRIITLTLSFQYAADRVSGVLTTVAGLLINPTTPGVYSWVAYATGWATPTTWQGPLPPRPGFTQDVNVPAYLTVTSPYGTPGGARWYNYSTTAYATLDTGIVDYGNGTRRVFTYWSGDASGTDYSTSDPIPMDRNRTAVANWRTDYYLTVTSPYDSPTPTSGWFEAETLINASVASPWPGATGTRYICTGWTGTGSVPASGTTTSVNFTIDAPSSITWNWKTQYYLTVRTDPSGIVTIPGEGWNDATTTVPLTAPSVAGYTFLYWDVNGVSQGDGVASITVSMNMPRTATAHYQTIPVGGVWVPINKFELLIPWIGLTSLMAIAIVSVIYVKNRKKQQN